MLAGPMICALCLVVLAVFHSYLGERWLLVPLLASADFPGLAIGRRFAKGVLRFAWHVTSLAWLTIAYMLIRGECSLGAVAIMCALSAAATHGYTRGRHGAWAVFAIAAVAAATSVWDGALWPRTAAVVGAVLLAAIGSLHVAWAFGARIGSGSAVPEIAGKPLFTPPRGLTLLVALGLFAASWLLLALAQLVPAPLPAPWLWCTGAAAAVVFGVRTIGDLRFVGLFKRVQHTRFARMDDLLFTPLCFVLSAAIVLQLI
jgi:hypothetical protein